MIMTKELYDAAVKCKDRHLMIVPGGDHNDTFLRAGVEYTNRLKQFMDKCNGDIQEERSFEELKQENDGEDNNEILGDLEEESNAESNR